jgi:hypothetical protein
MKERPASECRPQIDVIFQIKFFNHGPFIFGFPTSWGTYLLKTNISGIQKARLTTVIKHPTPKMVKKESERLSTTHLATLKLM